MKVKAVYFCNKLAVKLNKELIIVCSVILIAVISGAISIFVYNSENDINSLLISHTSMCSESSLFKIFMNFFVEHLLFLAVCFVSGSSVYGKMPIYIMSFFKFAGISAITGMLIKTYLLKGLEYCLLIFMPGKILLIFAIVYTSVVCLKASDFIKRTTETEEFNHNIYMKQILLSVVIFVLSALTDSFMIKMFLPLFDFS